MHPILDIDMIGYSNYNNDQCHALQQTLQEELEHSARTFMPFGKVWDKWKRQGTGDGYTLMFDALTPHIALKYALQLCRLDMLGFGDTPKAKKDLNHD